MASMFSVNRAEQPMTTLMICNIPAALSCRMLREEVHRWGFGQKYGLLHVVRGGSSAKKRKHIYGFVDFWKQEDAEAFQALLHGHKFVGFDNAKNGLAIRPSRVQGFAKCIEVIERSEEQHGLRGLVFCQV